LTRAADPARAALRTSIRRGLSRHRKCLELYRTLTAGSWSVRASRGRPDGTGRLCWCSRQDLCFRALRETGSPALGPASETSQTSDIQSGSMLLRSGRGVRTPVAGPSLREARATARRPRSVRRSEEREAARGAWTRQQNKAMEDVAGICRRYRWVQRPARGAGQGRAVRPPRSVSLGAGDRWSHARASDGTRRAAIGGVRYHERCVRRCPVDRHLPSWRSRAGLSVEQGEGVARRRQRHPPLCPGAKAEVRGEMCAAAIGSRQGQLGSPGRRGLGEPCLSLTRARDAG
jgi:hypothetical protein